jgi:hypothetical protein
MRRLFYSLEEYTGPSILTAACPLFRYYFFFFCVLLQFPSESVCLPVFARDISIVRSSYNPQISILVTDRTSRWDIMEPSMVN